MILPDLARIWNFLSNNPARSQLYDLIKKYTRSLQRSYTKFFPGKRGPSGADARAALIDLNLYNIKKLTKKLKNYYLLL